MTGKELFDEVRRQKGLVETWLGMEGWERAAYKKLAREGEGKLASELAWELIQPRVVMEKR